ncbi:MORN repeat variant [Algoriphagus winogradskyi]|uniref:MORN repeat variant n=2 Tax=Algoriphagus winogradskyi TaxID=237017 RepID=A0ABY1PE32_9BACT|nr:MORN repeat variant [Algoriphagus winogradskyi]
MQLINLFLFLTMLLTYQQFMSKDGSLDQDFLEVEALEVHENKLILHPNEGLMYLGKTPFSGAGMSYYANGVLAKRTEYVNGKRNGLLQKWFEDGSIAFEAHYNDNKLNGPVKSWWSNKNLRSSGNFLAGKSHGLQQQWYSSGVKFKEMNLVDGKEVGMQRAWRENGKIYVNYQAKNGRIYGLKRANLCFELDDETVVYND